MVAANNCSFPDYGFPGSVAGASDAGLGGTPVANGGSGGSGGAVTVAGSGGTIIVDAGAAGATGGGAGEGAAGEAGAGGSGGEPCVFPVPVNYPPHCFNKAVGPGESGVDCGGSECAPCSGNQACTQASDCLSQQCASNNTCVPLLSLTYAPIDTIATTPKPKFTLNITYLDTQVMSLADLTIRYYYNHKNAIEPIVGLDSQATIDPGNSQMDISGVVLTTVHRFPVGPVDGKGLTTDSYLEIGFNDTRVVTTGTKFVITQDFVAGNSTPLFDQNGHYSFSTSTGPNTALTVHRAGRRIWGVEPPMALFPKCAFSQGVNFNGLALTVGGESLLAETEAEFDFGSATTYSNTNKLVPAADEPTTTLLGKGRTLNAGQAITWSVPNGKYWAYAWLTSLGTGGGGTLSFGSRVADPFANDTSAGSRWGLIGPYAVDVAGGALELTVNGSVNIAGLKLYEAAR